MPERFNLDATLVFLSQGFYALVGHVCFEAGIYGFIVTVCAGLMGWFFRFNKSFHKYSVPLLVVAGKLSIMCLILALPGTLILTVWHSLPPTGVLNISPLAFIIFWSWICLHLSAEEMNFEFF